MSNLDIEEPVARM